MAVTVRRGRRISLLSKASKCVAAWHAGGMNGPSLTPGGQLRDFVNEKHHATFPGGTNDPLSLGQGEPLAYVYFPGSSGNSLTITLAISTAYFYTITYSDGTTDTDTQTSDGSGVLTFGGTDAKFAGLKVRRILITTDADHNTTVADVLAYDIRYWNNTRTSLTAVQGQTVTVNRTTTSARIVDCVDAPGLMLGTDDYLEVASHANLEPTGTLGFTAVVVLHGYASATQMLLGKKDTAADTTAGWSLRTNGAGNAIASVADGSTIVSTGTGSFKTGRDFAVVWRLTPQMVLGRSISAIDAVDPPVFATADASALTRASFANNVPFRIGAIGNATPAVFASIVFRAGAIWQRALSDVELQRALWELGKGVPTSRR